MSKPKRPPKRRATSSGTANLTTVKLSQEMKDMAKELVAELSEHGWASFGIKRNDPPRLFGVIEEGIKALSEKSPKHRKQGA